MMNLSLRGSLLLPLLLIFLCCSSRSLAAEVLPGHLIGQVKDKSNGETLGWTNLYLQEINRAVTAHENGAYHFMDIPPGEYHLQVYRVGYHNRTIRVEIEAGKTHTVDIYLDVETIYSKTILVEADSQTNSFLYQSDIHISGENLRENLGLTLAETLEDEPGLSQRSMGPAPARPVLRGLDGDRLLIVEDGQRIGDLSATASDHAVVIDPINSDLIEVIRGPKAMIYGSNTIAGVIDVSRNFIPGGRPHKTEGSLTLQGESINSGLAGAVKAVVPAGKLAISTDGSWRKAASLRTPQGILENTAIKTYNASLGSGYYSDWGMIGSAFSQYNSEYGIPPLPDSAGGHPGGANIRMYRSHFESRLEFYNEMPGIKRTEINYSYSSYFHEEYPPHSSGQSTDQALFGVETHNLQLNFHLNKSKILKYGLLGVWAESRKYIASGSNFTTDANEKAGSVFYFHEYQHNNFSVGGTVRYDFRRVDPEEKKFSNTLNDSIRIRSLSGFSAAAGLKYNFGQLEGGLNLFKSLRLPGVEELYSEGPHVAAYAYEVGNPGLKAEKGLGTELFFELKTDRLNGRLAVYQNLIDGYIYPKNTNRHSSRRYDLIVYQYVGQTALMRGAEAALHWHFTNNWFTRANFSYVSGRLPEQDEFLPRIPPLEYKLNLSYKKAVFSAGITARGASAQNNLAEYEEPTAAYLLFDLDGHYNLKWLGYFHTLTMQINNLTNKTYYNHLNRVKIIMPEPGRNLNILYRVYF